MKRVKYTFLIIFYSVILQSMGQDIGTRQRDIRVYFQCVSYSYNQNIASTLVIYDACYHKIDSVIIPQEGLYLNLTKSDLIFKVRANDVKYRIKKEVVYANELKDSLTIFIDPKIIDRCHVNLEEIFFEENSCELDSTAISELLVIKKHLLIADDSSHCLIVEIHSHTDALEKINISVLLTNRAHAVMNVLSVNNKINFQIYDKDSGSYYIEKPKSNVEHKLNRCVGFKISNQNCYQKDLIIKE